MLSLMDKKKFWIILDADLKRALHIKAGEMEADLSAAVAAAIRLGLAKELDRARQLLAEEGSAPPPKAKKPKGG